MNAIASWKKLANAELCRDSVLHVKPLLDHNDLDPDGAQGSAEVQPERRSGGQKRRRAVIDRPPSLNVDKPAFDFGTMRKTFRGRMPRTLRQDVTTCFSLSAFRRNSSYP